MYECVRVYGVHVMSILDVKMLNDETFKYLNKISKVRLCGGAGPMSSGATSDELDFAAPFGPTATPARGRK